MIYDVIIIGCGPVGAVAANLLGQSGHRVLVLEQFTDAFPLPRAVHLDHEMMRLFQQMGLADQILPLTRETQGHLHLGADGDVIRYMGSVGQPKRFGWANDYFFYQPELEAILRAGFKRFANIDFRQGVVVDGVRNLDDGCEVTAASPTSHGQTFHARYVIGCDGARSPVRESLGIALDDLNFEEAWLVVDANVAGPISFPPIPSLPQGVDVQQLSVMTCDPRRPATIVPGRGPHRRWEFMLLPGESEAGIVEPVSIQRLVAPWLQGCTYEIVRTATYKFNARVAHQWRKGRVFLAGDAAHQTPPFFGQGMCHGLRDVSNLSFKLDLVLRGRARDTLLDTYQPERDPQVRHVIGAAVAAGRYICELDPQKARARDAEIRQRQRSGQDIATAADLIAPYGEGLVTAGGGERFVQPRVRYQGREMLLDDASRQGFVLIADAPVSHPALEALGIRVFVAEGSPELSASLAAHGASAVLLRPDHYVYGWVTQGQPLDALLKCLNEQLNPSTKPNTMPELTLAHARTIIATALQTARAQNLSPLAIIVLDAGARPIAAEREDGAGYLRLDIATAKAAGAIGMGYGTRDLARRAAGNPGFYAALYAVSGGQMVPSPGGVLIRNASGAVIGAVGVSGDTGEHDEQAAVAGLEATGLAYDTGASQ